MYYICMCVIVESMSSVNMYVSMCIHVCMYVCHVDVDMHVSVHMHIYSYMYMFVCKACACIIFAYVHICDGKMEIRGLVVEDHSQLHMSWR